MSKSFTGYHILLLELIYFQKLQPPKHQQRQTVSYVIRIQRLHKLQYHSRVFGIFQHVVSFIQQNPKKRQ